MTVKFTSWFGQEAIVCLQKGQLALRTDHRRWKKRCKQTMASWFGREKGVFFRFFFSGRFYSPKEAVYMGRKRIFRSIAWLNDQNEKKRKKKVMRHQWKRSLWFSFIAFASKRYCHWSSSHSIANEFCYLYLSSYSSISLWFPEKVTTKVWVSGALILRLSRSKHP